MSSFVALNDPNKLKQPKPPAPPSTVMNQPGVPAPQLAQRPVQQPGVRTAAPGPVPQFTAGQTPAAPAPAPAPPAPGAGGAPLPAGQGYNFYGSGGGTSAQAGSLESGLRDYISGAFNGTTSQKFINDAKSQLGAGLEGQRAQAVNQINDDAIRRGMFKSGIPAEAAAGAGRAKTGALASGVADILKNAEQMNAAGRESAAGQASSLLGANRQMDQYTQQRLDQEKAQRAAAAAANANKTFTYIDPETGTSYEMPTDW